LRFQRGAEGGAGRLEGRREGIAYHFKDKSVMRLNGPVQNLMVPRKQSRHRIGILLCKFGTAFDIGKKKCNCTGR
jgi:hypothetical protein